MAIVIIGAGIGGLAAAIALAARGEAVTVLERQHGAGGKMLPLQVGDASFDSGPTVMTMRWVFDALFDCAGDSLDAHLTLEPLERLARHYWTGGQALDLFADATRSKDAIGTFAGRKNAEGFASFSREARHIHQALIGPFLKSQRPTPWGLTARMSFRDLFRINPFENLWHALGRHFDDPRLRQLFGRYATYCGSSPFKAPATLMLVAEVEASGVWRIAGGMAALAAALERRARASGVAFHFGCTVQKIETEGGKVSAVIDDRGERHACSAVIMNGDAAALADGLLGEAVRRASARVAQGERSLSAITWCAVSESQGVALDHHTVFFSDDYAQEFVELAHGPARDPTVYVCEQGEGRKLLLVNAPATGQAAPADIDTRLTKRLARSGITINLQGAFRRDPKDFNAIYPATHGALYGRATHGWMSTFLRPQARSKVPGLYLAGGSAHPGPGVPMAALSGLRAAEALLQDHASMRR